MTKRGWIIFAAIVVVLFGTIFYFSNKNKVDVSSIDTNSVLSASEASGNIGDHVTGPKTTSKVVLVEYGDYQCPGCGSAYQPIKTATEKYKDNVTFVFRNFPLTTIHPNAKAAAAAAEAAGLMGKYWEMHDKLYENQQVWQGSSGTDRTALFADYAQQIGLNREKFLATINDNAENINKKISFDQALGKKVGVSGTPAFFLNGKEVTEYVKDGKIVDPSTKDANPVWSDAEAFDTLIIQPALKEAGIDVSSKK